MLVIKDYGFKNKEITEKDFKTIDGMAIMPVIKNFGRILQLIEENTTSSLRKETLGDAFTNIDEIEVYRNGIRVKVSYTSVDPHNPTECATFYILSDGIYFIRDYIIYDNGLLCTQYERQDTIKDELYERLGNGYLFLVKCFTGFNIVDKEGKEQIIRNVQTFLGSIASKEIRTESLEVAKIRREYRELQELTLKPIKSLEDLYRIKELTKIIEDLMNEEKEDVKGYEVCRKAKYSVQIELGCYKLEDGEEPKEGFTILEREEDGKVVRYAVKKGQNVLEKNNWTTSPERPYIITGTVGERWPVKPSNLSAYEVNPEDITIEPTEVFTKDPDDQEFLVCKKVDISKTEVVFPTWCFKEDGTIDDAQVLVANDKGSSVSHEDGDYIVAKHIEGAPEYMDLPLEVRATKNAAKIYSPRIVNGSVMKKTYDRAKTKEEIISKYHPEKAKRFIFKRD